MLRIAIACLGVALIAAAIEIGQWLAPPGRIDYIVKFTLVICAVVFGVAGIVLLFIAGLTDDSREKVFAKVKSISGWTPASIEKRYLEVMAKYQVGTSPSEFIAMKDAATKLYTEARTKNAPFAKAVEQLSSHGSVRGSPDDILDVVATKIAHQIQAYGKRPPSTAYEEISKQDLREYVFKDGGSRLRHLFNQSVYITDVCVKSDALDGVRESLQTKSVWENL